MKIYYAKIKPLFKEEKYQRYYHLLPLTRQRRADAYLNQDDRIRSVAAFSLLIKLLNEQQINYRDEDFKIDENGKLYLANSKIHFNLSHSGDYVMAAISDNPIGVDVEFMKRGKKFEELIDQVFNSDEINEYRHTPNRRMFFYQIWTLKESYIKCIGKGLQIKMSEINLSRPEFSGYLFHLFLYKNHQFAICSYREPVAKVKEIKL